MRIKIGDKLPNSELFYLDQNNDVKKIDILDLCKGKTIILGMPGAFTKTCSALHLPGYIKNYELANKKGISKIVCVAVNDPNVMKAWGENQNAGSKIFMAGDPFLKFTKAIGAEVDKSEKGLGIRSNRYTMLVENGEVKKVEEEKETATCELSSAESFLKSISVISSLSSNPVLYFASNSCHVVWVKLFWFSYRVSYSFIGKIVVLTICSTGSLK